MPRIEPAIQTLQFSVDPAIAQYQYIDLMQTASLINRRAYKQGVQVAVAGFTVISVAPQNVLIEKLPSTWVVSAAWEKSMRAWKRQQDEVLEDGMNQSSKARFNDYKIYFDAFHAGTGSLLPDASLLPAPGAGTNAHWDYSQVVIPNFGAVGVNYEPYLHMLGADVGGAGGSKGLIKAYANSRAVPQSPDPAAGPGVTSTDNWLNSMFDVGDNNEDVMENVVNKNRDLPYDQLNYPGEGILETEIVDFCSITGTTIGGMTRGKGSVFPCGLIKLTWTPKEGTPNLTVQINLIPGSTRGYLAEPMQDM